jgi:hypothetical protein
MKKVNKFPYKRVKIYWVDIVSNSEWMSLDKAKDQVYSWCEDTQVIYYIRTRRDLSYLHRIALTMMEH